MTGKKKELASVLGRILAYVLVMSLFESTHAHSAGQGWRVLLAALILGALLAELARKNGFSAIGLTPHTPLAGRKTLYLLPMIAVSTANLWHGAAVRYAPKETVWYIIAMLCIGFIEEILFRGYLLRLLLKRSSRLAIWISSLTFGVVS